MIQAAIGATFCVSQGRAYLALIVRVGQGSRHEAVEEDIKKQGFARYFPLLTHPRASTLLPGF